MTPSSRPSSSAGPTPSARPLRRFGAARRRRGSRCSPRRLPVPPGCPHRGRRCPARRCAPVVHHAARHLGLGCAGRSGPGRQRPCPAGGGARRLPGGPCRRRPVRRRCRPAPAAGRARHPRPTLAGGVCPAGQGPAGVPGHGAQHRPLPGQLPGGHHLHETANDISLLHEHGKDFAEAIYRITGPPEPRAGRGHQQGPGRRSSPRRRSPATTAWSPTSRSSRRPWRSPRSRRSDQDARACRRAPGQEGPSGGDASLPAGLLLLDTHIPREEVHHHEGSSHLRRSPRSPTRPTRRCGRSWARGRQPELGRRSV